MAQGELGEKEDGYEAGCEEDGAETAGARSAEWAGTGLGDARRAGVDVVVVELFVHVESDGYGERIYLRINTVMLVYCHLQVERS